MHRCRTHGLQPQSHFLRLIVRGLPAWTCAAGRRATWRRYNQTGKGAARYRRYDRTERRAGVWAVYNTSEKGRARRRRYGATDQGIAASFKHDMKRGRV